jgi:hypothetical protein
LLGEPDPFRFKHRTNLRQVVADAVRDRLDRKPAAAFLAKRTEEKIAPDERERSREMAEADLLGLHEDNFACYQLRPAEFAAWREVWAVKTTR